jgi:hypothetical protein
VLRTDHSPRGVLPTVVCLSECDDEVSVIRRPWPRRAFAPLEKIKPLGAGVV